MSLSASAVVPMSHSFIGDDMIIAAALLLLHLLLYKCIRSTNMSVSSHTTRTDLPESDIGCQLLHRDLCHHCHQSIKDWTLLTL